MPSSLSDSAHHQLNMYAVAASAAGVAVLALAQSSEAKVVYTKAHHSIPLNSRYNLDLNHDGITDFVLSNVTWSGDSGGGDQMSVFPMGNEVMVAYQNSHGSFASALPAGARIRANRKFKAISGKRMALSCNSIFCSEGSGRWLNVNNRYLGLRFAIKGKTHYGWARLNVSCVVLCKGLLTGYAYETVPNKSIIAGETKGPDDDVGNDNPGASITNPVPDLPQPASLGALARGAPGLSIWRRESLWQAHSEAIDS
jgi:hypothetical protein